MLTPDDLLHISEGAEEIAAQLHTDIIKRIIARILEREKRGESYILTAIDKWQIQTLQDIGFLREDIIKEIARATAYEEREIRAAFRYAGVKTMRYDDRIYEAAGLPTSPMSPYMEWLMQRSYTATMGEWRNYTRSTADIAQDAFIRSVDTAYNNITSGNVGYIQAFAEAIDALASNGIYKIVYPTGYIDTIETATLRCVRTGVSQATAQIQIARMDDMGVDLVLVSSHMGARPSHQVWQGRVFSRSGKGYPDFVESTGYGTGPGLCGWNCRHSFSPYFEGMDNPFEHYDDQENRELYEKTQHQRSMERGIRKTKRRVETLGDAARNAGDAQLQNDLNARLRAARKQLAAQKKAYAEYCDENKLKPLPERMRIAKAS